MIPPLRGRDARALGVSLLLATWIVLLANGLPSARAGLGLQADVALIVAVDVSQSVDQERYRLQMEGIAQALEDPGVISAIVNGANGNILITMIAWADSATPVLDWTRISSKADAYNVAALVRRLPHKGGEFTCMARMLRGVALRVIPEIPIKANRVVLDVSGDGIDNCSDRDALHEERDRVLALSATINGLPIIVPGENETVGSGAYRAPGFGLRELSRQPDKETTTLDQWFKDHVIGGPGAFLMAAQGYADFGRALRQKFVTEISDAACAPAMPRCVMLTKERRVAGGV